MYESAFSGSSCFQAEGMQHPRLIQAIIAATSSICHVLYKPKHHWYLEEEHTTLSLAGDQEFFLRKAHALLPCFFEMLGLGKCSRP